MVRKQSRQPTIDRVVDKLRARSTERFGEVERIPSTS